MNTIRALNVRSRIEALPGRQPELNPQSYTPSTFIAPLGCTPNTTLEPAGAAATIKLPVKSA